MKLINKLVLTTVIAGVSASCFAISDSAKLGANAGAMSYCSKHFPDGNETTYKLLKLKTTKEFGDLDEGTKLKAMVYKKAAEDGDYLGDPLNKSRCNKLRKMLHVKYN
ncbi:hypothetical protein [Motilimonas eburnea]|uniref:hypothetical protein n=1 Tax=Motilimonas eburnea TaxID=1737488 RepID=UPI001E563BA9|nr:hypothetical protein [Motilimonas eburnea]MCE2570262.1 hypothetical protein [Motilimonas eburnea]